MKKQLLLLMLGGATLLSSCEVTINESESSEKEESELKNGFSYESIDRSVNGIVPVTDEVIGGELLIIKFNGVANATLKDGFQHVGIALKVYRPDGEVYDESEDLLSNIEQQDPKVDNCHFYFAIPEEFIGSKMRIEYQLFDKYGDGTYDFTEEFDVIEALPPLTKGVELETSLDAEIYTQVFEGEYQKEQCPVEVDNDFNLKLYLSNVSGFAIDEYGEASLTYKVSLEDSFGIVEEIREELLAGPVGDVNGYPFSFSLNYADLSSGNYLWRVDVSDNNSDQFMNITVPIKVK